MIIYQKQLCFLTLKKITPDSTKADCSFAIATKSFACVIKYTNAAINHDQHYDQPFIN